ncbi:MAG: PilW family protein [Spongiibacteraceae bacterium]
MAAALPVIRLQLQLTHKDNFMRASHFHSSRGFSIVELMIAIVLGLILIAGVIQVFLGNRQTQLTEQAVARVQEAGRLAIDFIEADMRGAGFYGTGTLPDTSVATPPSIQNDVINAAQFNEANFTSNAVRVYSRATSGTWVPSDPSGQTDIAGAVTVANSRPGSDLIAVFYGEMTAAEISGSVSGASSVSITTNGACFKQNDLVMLAKPGYVTIFRVTNTPSCSAASTTLAHATSANTTGSFSNSYDQYAHVMKLHTQIYYVADTGRDNSAGDPVWALYRSSDGAAAEELVEGIEFLKLAYGARLSSGNIRYGDASVISANQIVSARVGVLAQSLDSVRTTSDTSSYSLPGATITAAMHGGGKALRRVFTTNIELRNRAL